MTHFCKLPVVATALRQRCLANVSCFQFSFILLISPDILSELSQAQNTCITIRASIPQYALSRAEALQKACAAALTDAAAAAGASAVLEIEEEALFHLFQHFAQLRNIYVVLYTLLHKHRVLLGL